MDTGDDLANAGLDAGLVTQICDVFAGLAYDDAGVFCAYKGAEGEGLLEHGRGGVTAIGIVYRERRRESVRELVWGDRSCERTDRTRPWATEERAWEGENGTETGMRAR